MSILDKIEKNSDLKKLKPEELKKISEEIRKEILFIVSKNGGHLAPNLGVVELTLGIHLALDLPKDKIVWDVGHQCYTHKILTGRREEFKTIRTYNGLSGFPRKEESEYDTVNTGHASTSVSSALGIVKGRDIKKEKFTVVAVIGDGSLTGGLAYEGLNQAGHLKSDIIVILNDNDMSIDQNVGALSSYLNKIRNDFNIARVRKEAEEKIAKIPKVGNFFLNIGLGVKKSVEKLFSPGRFFEELGFYYIGPIDGHDPLKVKEAIEFAKETGGPVLIHVCTTKGKGYLPAEENPGHFHGIPPFDLTAEKVESGKILAPGKKSYMEIFGEAMVELAEKDDKIVAISAAMTRGTGLDEFSKKFTKRFFDVGIAEGHAVSFASGLALSGLKPVVAIYSTFLQRSYDQLIHDAALPNLPIVFALDRAGLVGEDGPTHHGVFDLSYLSSIPGMTVMAPSDEQELRDMLYTAFSINGPVAIRFPRGQGVGVEIKKVQKIEIGKAKVVKKGNDVLIIAVGRMLQNATEAAELLSKQNITATVVDARFVKPFDEELFLNLIPKHKLVVTVEENGPGGFANLLSKFMNEKNLKTQALFCHIPDRFITHGTIKQLTKEVELDPESLVRRILNRETFK